MKKLSFILALFALASCSEGFKYKEAEAGENGHLEEYLVASKKATSAIQSDSLDLKQTIALKLALAKYQEKFPERYQSLESETNGWQIAKNLKRDKAFVSFAKQSGLDLKKIQYIGKE
jgi:hypothetical protein